MSIHDSDSNEHEHEHDEKHTQGVPREDGASEPDTASGGAPDEADDEDDH
ncbi:hypothetical protein [Gryllotalpicola protaetiae]|nr:hypothetical protein [Gryllotalpicola protaetiae]